VLPCFKFQELMGSIYHVKDHEVSTVGIASDIDLRKIDDGHRRPQNFMQEGAKSRSSGEQN